jgi:hypothetical protein
MKNYQLVNCLLFLLALGCPHNNQCLGCRTAALRCRHARQLRQHDRDQFGVPVASTARPFSLWASPQKIGEACTGKEGSWHAHLCAPDANLLERPLCAFLFRAAHRVQVATASMLASPLLLRRVGRVLCQHQAVHGGGTAALVRLQWRLRRLLARLLGASPAADQ